MVPLPSRIVHLLPLPTHTYTQTYTHACTQRTHAHPHAPPQSMVLPSRIVHLPMSFDDK